MESLGFIVGISLNVYLQYLVYRDLFIYYMHKGNKNKFEENKTEYSVAIIVFSLVVYSVVFGTAPIIALAFMVGLIYLAYTLNKKWKTNDTLPEPFGAIDNNDELSDLD